MTIETVPLSTIHLDPANVRTHPQRNLDAITASLARFGQQKPIVVDARGMIRAGNGTYVAAQALGWTHINVVRTSLVDAEAIAYAIADNRTTDLGAWDTSALAQQWAALDAELQSIAGFNQQELDDLLKDLPAVPEPEPLTDLSVPELYQVVVDCGDETRQQELFTRLKEEGYKCRLSLL